MMYDLIGRAQSVYRTRFAYRTQSVYCVQSRQLYLHHMKHPIGLLI